MCTMPDTTGPARRRSPELDGLRGVAIVMVMLYHFKIYGSGWDFPARHGFYNLIHLGWAGVDVFFVLSGFLITGILLDSRHNESYYRVFYSRRTLRIFPLYYATLAAIFFALPPFLRQTGFYSADRTLLETPQWPAWCYVQNWTSILSKAIPVSTLISHFWSLCVEEQFYLIWPVCIRILKRPVPMIIFAGCLIVLAPIARYAMHLAGMNGAAYVFTVCRMDALAMGALLAVGMRARRHWRLIRKMAPVSATLACLGLCAAIALSHSVRSGGILMDTVGLSCIDLLAAAVIALLIAEGAPAWYIRLARGRILRFFGKYSYALYVFHQPAIYLMACAGLSAAALTARFHSVVLAILLVNAAGFSVSIALALMSWNLLEKHFLKLKDKMGPKPFAIRLSPQENNAAINLRAI